MPHLNIKYFDQNISEEDKFKISESLTKIILYFFDSKEASISIALEPINPIKWKSEVYDKEIINKKNLLIKYPEY